MLKPADKEFLEDIKIDLEEEIPLSAKKREYLKEAIMELKRHRSKESQKSKIQEQDITEKKGFFGIRSLRIGKHNSRLRLKKQSKD